MVCFSPWKAAGSRGRKHPVQVDVPAPVLVAQGELGDGIPAGQGGAGATVKRYTTPRVVTPP